MGEGGTSTGGGRNKRRIADITRVVIVITSPSVLDTTSHLWSMPAIKVTLFQALARPASP
ncbi:hypothetical protein GCM10008957_53140 [Deinococcus ruber]|uniref:Uncharacterized protein n=1 Tax=Deinococcus ruber TaxID=1848197 RepID=A0A918KW96_9DEIO|nr:hypothetical protein GCM10008957_53140 [Deinococcus ruber]